MSSSLGFWKPKEKWDETNSCAVCTVTFTTFNRRHHCRYCARSLCSACCGPHKEAIPDHGIDQPVRVCPPCREVIRGCRTVELEDREPAEHEYNFDLLVIGGGSGGLACAKQAQKHGKLVAVCDFVLPSPQNTTWGIGGTCVNVGCIPKKLMHQAALLGEARHDGKAFGWEAGGDDEPVTHNWTTLVDNIQQHIAGLNTGYINQLKDNDITYFNAYASFKDFHTIKLAYADGTSKEVTARRIVVAVGGRPRYPDIPGAKEHCITSDDIFSLKAHPGKKVLVVGASYVALECAGFLHGIGCDVTVMVRSILLRGFDQEVANKIGDYMEASGVKFIRGAVPARVEKDNGGGKEEQKSKKKEKNTTGYKVWWCNSSTARKSEEEKSMESMSCDSFDNVLLAVGRVPLTSDLHLCCAKVMRDQGGKIQVYREQTNIPHIYAIGDVASVYGCKVALELTPVAIQAGRLLANRLYANSTTQMDYEMVATTIFTPIEYGCCGMTEEEAIEEYGEEPIEVFHQVFQPLEMTLPKRMNKGATSCFVKLVLNMHKGGKLIGFHFMGPNAGEVTQGVALAMRAGVTKDDLDSCVGIHPTVAETFCTMEITKGSGKSAVKEDC